MVSEILLLVMAMKWVRQYIERKLGQNILGNWGTGKIKDWLCEMLIG